MAYNKKFALLVILTTIFTVFWTFLAMQGETLPHVKYIPIVSSDNAVQHLFGVGFAFATIPFILIVQRRYIFGKHSGVRQVLSKILYQNLTILKIPELFTGYSVVLYYFFHLLFINSAIKFHTFVFIKK